LQIYLTDWMAALGPLNSCFGFPEVSLSTMFSNINTHTSNDTELMLLLKRLKLKLGENWKSTTKNTTEILLLNDSFNVFNLHKIKVEILSP